MTVHTNPRRFPMQKPEGHNPVIQRYSSRVDPDVTQVRVLVFGQQTKSSDARHREDFRVTLTEIFESAGTPLHHDLATFTDPESHTNTFAVCYWQDEAAYENWKHHFDIWWAGKDPKTLDRGYWAESFSVPVEYRETIAFKEYVRGLSACPMSRMEPMDESGYWGAARDRFNASANDRLSPEPGTRLEFNDNRDTIGKRITIVDVPDQLCVIRSGVTWKDCGEEQLHSYRTNLEPKLDAGMDYLRENPEETGCCSLRQVECLDEAGEPAREAYSLGLFLSFRHLEEWAHDHPTHLAIYTRALAERKKYQEDLELRTYHEIYVLNENTSFDYLNCHPKTGLLPYFSIESTE